MEIAALPAWVPTLLSALAVGLVLFMLQRDARRKDLQDQLNIQTAKELADLRLMLAKEYFSSEQSKELVNRIEAVLQELHRQNIAFARMETEIKAIRQSGTMHQNFPVHQSGHEG